MSFFVTWVLFWATTQCPVSSHKCVPWCVWFQGWTCRADLYITLVQCDLASVWPCQLCTSEQTKSVTLSKVWELISYYADAVTAAAAASAASTIPAGQISIKAFSTFSFQIEENERGWVSHPDAGSSGNGDTRGGGGKDTAGNYRRHWTSAGGGEWEFSQRRQHWEEWLYPTTPQLYYFCQSNYNCTQGCYGGDQRRKWNNKIVESVQRNQKPL